MDGLELLKHKRNFIFHVLREETDEEVCRIHYTETLTDEKATLEVLNEALLPIDIKIGTKSTNALLVFLKDRILPSNRMFLAEELQRRGISPDDWITMIQLNKGMTYTDKYYIITERIYNENI